MLLGCGSTAQLGGGGQHPDLIDECKVLFRQQKWEEAIGCLDQISDADRDQAYYDLRGTVYSQMNELEWANEAFKRGIELDTGHQNPYLYFKKGEVLWKKHEHLKAGQFFAQYNLLVEQAEPSIRKSVEYYIRSAAIADSLYLHPREYTLTRLPESINTPADELGLSMTDDRREIYLTRRTHQEDLYYSQNLNGQWMPARPLTTLNTPDNEGAMAISGDGRTLVFTSCQRPEGVGSCDLYYSNRTDTGWSEPKLIPNINSRYWDSQPTLSSDGRAIVFSSERPGGYGGKDLWLSAKNAQNEWIRPVNLGSNVNSPGNEENPFLHTDEFTLYFTSDYWPGFGGRDLFLTHRIRGNEWTEPKNLGYPINSMDHEEGVFVESSGNIGYLASSRSGNFDLYSFPVDSAIRPRPSYLYELIVLDSSNLMPINEADVTVFDWTHNRLIRSKLTAKDGYAGFVIEEEREYGITVVKEGYNFRSLRVKSVSDLDTDWRDSLWLTPRKSGTTLILENVHFEIGQADLLEASWVELDELAEYLQENEEIVIVLQGHTDNVGSEKDNNILSQKRAEAVKTYLEQRGVQARRIEAIGKGESQPIASNDTAEGRQKNRRTEIIMK